MASNGGFPDDIFIFPPSEDFRCPVCSLILRDPHVLMCCEEAVVCQPCSVSTEKCVLCDDVFDDSIPDKRMRREIMELTVRCTNRKDCDWVGELFNMEEHSKKGCPLTNETKRSRKKAKADLEAKIAKARESFMKKREKVHTVILKASTELLPITNKQGRRGTISEPDRQKMEEAAIDSAASGDWVNVMKLLESGVSANTSKANGTTLLHYACCKNGSTDAVRDILSYGGDPKVRDWRRVTPLHLVARNGHAHSAILLISRGADFNLQDTDRQTPLHIACLHGHWEVVTILLQYDVDLDTLDRRQNTALVNACIKGFTDIVMDLLDKAKDKAKSATTERETETKLYVLSEMYQMTPLHIAAAAGHTDIVEALLDEGASPVEIDLYGHTPLNWAILRDHTDTAKSILLFADEFSGIRKEAEIKPISLQWKCSTLLLATVLNNEEVQKEMMVCGVKQQELTKYKLIEGWVAVSDGISHNLTYRNMKTDEILDYHPKLLDDQV